MRSFQSIDVIARAEFLDVLDLVGEYITLPKIKRDLWHRGYEEQISFKQQMKLGKFLISDEFFKEVEPLLFYHYKDGTDVWEKELDHIYRRSITPKHLIN